MAYPYTNQGFTEGKNGFNTGRVLFVENPADFTPREFLSFIDEGFVPVIFMNTSGTISYAFASWKAEDGEYTLGTATSYDLDEAFEVSSGGPELPGPSDPVH